MFVDSVTNVVSFLPNRSEEKTFKVSETQCDLLNKAEKFTEPEAKKNVEVQTSEVVDTAKLLSDNEANIFRILAFLQKVSPLVEDALIENQISRAFDGYDLLVEDEDTESKVLHKFKASNFPKMSVTALEWNASGAAVAAAYGHSSHSQWCTHEAGICVWYPNKSRLDANKPHHLITTNGCLTAIAFHPIEPSTLIGATYYGDVYVWNLTQEDLLIHHALPSSLTHSEVVSQIRFLQINAKSYQLLTASHDGYLVQWHKELKPVQRYVIPASEAPPSLSQGLKKNLETPMMLTAFDLEPNSQRFLVGTEEGALFLCTFPVQASGKSDINPVTQSLALFQGTVTFVQFCPFRSHLALAAGSNGELRLYDTLRLSLIVTLHAGEPVLCAAWTRPLLMVMGNFAGFTFLSLPSERVPVTKAQFKMELDAKKGEQESNTTAIKMCPNNPRLLATGNNVGDICIWQLPTALTSYDAQEMKTFENMTAVN